MAETTINLKEIVLRYCRELTKLGIRPTAVYLYGSFASGKQRYDSDIDLIVISPDLEKYGFIRRLEMLGLADGRILEPVEAIGFTPEEFKPENLTLFWKDVLEQGVISMECH